MRITRRGKALLLCAIVLFGLGEWLGYLFPRVLAFAAVAAVGAAFLLARRRVDFLVRRSVYPHEVSRGAEAAVRVVVRNRASRTSPRTIAVEPITTGAPLRTLVHPLSPNESVYRTYELPTHRRGRIVLGPMALRVEDPLRLVASVSTDPTTDEYWVLPRLHEADLLPPGRQPEYVGIAAHTHLRGATDFQSLREYEVGDDPRHVHWKSLARSSRLMVRQYADPPRPDLTVLLDIRHGVLSADAFEEAVEVAASLVMAGRRSKHRIRLRTTDGREVGDTGGAIVRRLCEVEQIPLVTADPGSSMAGPVALLTAGSAVIEVFRLLSGRAYPFVAIDLGPAPCPVDESGIHLIRASSAADAVAQWNLAVRR